jgi:hypothetical protein
MNNPVSFWRTKSDHEAAQVHHLEIKNPTLLAVLCYASWYCEYHFAKKLMLTSIWRDENDPLGMHTAWRAVDGRIWNEARDGGTLETTQEITTKEAQMLVDNLNAVFAYGKTSSGRLTHVAHYRSGGTGSDTAEHFHIQTKRKMSWQ